jgi:anti-sigma regulatory factor (Ser/Thr protein kinase)
VGHFQPAESSVSMYQQLPATVDSVAAARWAVRRFAAGLDVDLDGIVLAVSEAVANVVTHAYAEDATGSLELSAATSPFELTVVVRDEGRGLAGGTGSEGAGYGIEIIRRLAQHVEMADTSGGVALTMRFRRGGVWSVR